MSLVDQLYLLEFESRKHVLAIFSALLRRQIGTISPTVDYLATKPKLFDTLLISCGNPAISLNCSEIVRLCIKNEVLCRVVLRSPVFWALFDIVEHAQFQIAMNAFSTISAALSNHQETTAAFLAYYQSKLASKLRTLLAFDNYVTQRKVLKLVFTLICRKSNYSFMIFYCSDPANLQPIMALLTHQSSIMRFEAFQIFKIFVANPHKTKPITELLHQNKTPLIDVLQKLAIPDKKQSKIFDEEQKFIVSQLINLEIYTDLNFQNHGQ